MGRKKPFVRRPKCLNMYGEANEKFMQMYQDVADEVYIDKPHNWIKTGDNDL